MVLPSHLIRHYLPSDEDYKTLPFVISLQRWVKDLEYASFWPSFFRAAARTYCQASLGSKPPFGQTATKRGPAWPLVGLIQF